MEVRIVQAGNDAATLEVNNLRVGAALVTVRVVHAGNASVPDRDVAGFAMFRVERSDVYVVENQVSLLLRRFWHNASFKCDTTASVLPVFRKSCRVVLGLIC